MYKFTRDYRGWATKELFYHEGDVIEGKRIGNVAYLLNEGVIMKMDAEPEGEPDGDGNFDLPNGALDVQNAYDLESTGEIVFLADEQILDVHGIGPATLEGLRERYPYEEKEGK